jgi:hypothetical protein
MIFVRYDGLPKPPFEDYYRPFQKLDRVYWSMVGAGGVTSQAEREQVYRLAEHQPNLAGFILDDFFHGHATDRLGDAISEPWLAQNHCRFPVSFTITPPAPVACDVIELVQTDWGTGDYRSKDFAVDLSTDPAVWQEVTAGTFPNSPAAKVRLQLPDPEFAALRIRILSTHDVKAAMSCGLKALRLYRSDREVDLGGWKATASSSYPGFDATGALGVVTSFRASLTPEQLREIRQMTVRGHKLPLMAVVYTGQISPRARWHLNEVDQVCLWTWRPADLEHLEQHLNALEALIPGKPIFLGCYMYDFNDRRPLPVESMQRQTQLGYQWLKQGRIEGMIFLATANVDVGLEAVQWTRAWIAQVQGERLNTPR